MGAQVSSDLDQNFFEVEADIALVRKQAIPFWDVDPIFFCVPTHLLLKPFHAKIFNMQLILTNMLTS